MRQSPLFPDEELQTFLRDAAGLPDITSPEATRMITNPDALPAMAKAAMARRILDRRTEMAA